MPIVSGERITPFQAVASIADNTSMVTNWGSGGVEYINTDISLALTRLPDGVAVGLRTVDHVAAQGLAKGTVRFTPERPIPDDIVAAIVRDRIAELDAAARR